MIVRQRAVRLARRLSQAARPARRGVRAISRRLPIRVRDRLSRNFLCRPWTTTVPVHKVLLGSQAGLTAIEFADATGDLLWASTPLADGPHAKLFRQADGRAPDELTDEELLSSPYASMARRCIAISGHFFDADDDAGIVGTARGAISLHRTTSCTGHRTGGHRSDAGPAAGSSSRDTESILARVSASSYFQMLDGHHRLASAAVHGVPTVDATLRWIPVKTALQDLLSRMSWIGGNRELYQPVSAPELSESWTLVRRCEDRLTKMRRLLEIEGVSAPGATYLDVASCYGWFVAALRDDGFLAHGIERDPLAIPLGQAVYGLAPGDVDIGDCETFLACAPGRWDVVSCFSLLHHFVLGRGSIPPEALLHRLDNVTARVLFLDTGQDHERWLRHSLAGWDASHVADMLRRHTTFDRVVDLGPDDDDRPPYQDNYGRTMFAAIRDP